MCGCSRTERYNSVYVFGESEYIRPPMANAPPNSASSSSAEGSSVDTSSPPGENSGKPESSLPDIINEIPDISSSVENDDPIIIETPISNEPFLSDEEEMLGAQSLFVGDSICRGFAAYNVLSPKNVFAAGNIGARNLFDISVYQNGKEKEYIPVLTSLDPKYVFFWMGMNDLNMTESDEYCQNYKNIIDLTLQNSDAKIYVCAITPIHCRFTPRRRITEFNDAIRQFIEENYDARVNFIDFTDPLKDENGDLLDLYNSGDGIHLNEITYYIIMHQIFDKVGKV